MSEAELHQDQTQNKKIRKLNFKDPLDNIYALTKITGDHAGAVTYGYHTGVVFASRPGEKLKPLFGFVGFGVNRQVWQDDKTVRQLGKEIGFYTDLSTGEILKQWKNPYLGGEIVEVYHIYNHQMNIHWTGQMPAVTFGTHHKTEDSLNDGHPSGQKGGMIPFVLPWEVYGNRVHVALDAMMCYPNILKPSIWPRESTGEIITPSEHWTFITTLDQLEDQSCTCADYGMVLGRLGPYVPWMLMGTSPGHLFYRASAWKTQNWQDIPEYYRNYVEQNHPEFMQPPEKWENTPNVSSWETFARDRKPAPFPNKRPAQDEEEEGEDSEKKKQRN